MAWLWSRQNCWLYSLTPCCNTTVHTQCAFKLQYPPSNSSASSGSVQRSVYTTDGALALVYDIIQKTPYAPSLTQHTALTAPSVVGMLFSQHKHHMPLRGPAWCLHLRQVPTSQVGLGHAGLSFPCWRSYFLCLGGWFRHESLLSGKGSDIPCRKFPSQVFPCPIRARCGPLLLGKDLRQGPACPREGSHEAILIYQAATPPPFVLRNNPLTVKLEQRHLTLLWI